MRSSHLSLLPVATAVILILLGLSFVMVADSLVQGLRAGGDPDDLGELDDVDPNMAPWKIAALVIAGVIGLPLGADLLVTGAKSIALAIGVSETAIGLTLVAIGTSLPELATTVMAAIRRQSDVAIGNVIGSNIFNITAIIGTAALVGNLPVPDIILNRDLWVMIGASAVLIPLVLLCRPIGRLLGAVMFLLYIGYLTVAFA